MFMKQAPVILLFFLSGIWFGILQGVSAIAVVCNVSFVSSISHLI